MFIFVFFDVCTFLMFDFFSPPQHFCSDNLLALRRLLICPLVTLHKPITTRRHPKWGGHFSRHVRITRQMRFQLVKFLKSYEMHFSDLLEFLEENKQHFLQLEQIYLNGVGTPMHT